MYKKSSSIWTIVFRSFAGFFENFSVFFKCLLPPFLMQILASIVLGVGMFLAMMSAVGKNGSAAFLGSLIAIAGIVLLCKAIWDLLIRIGALVLISKQIVENESLRDIKYYVDIFKARRGYVTYLLITGLLIPLIPTIFALPKIIELFNFSAYGFNQSLTMYNLSIIFLIFYGFALVFGPFLVVTLQSFVLNPKLTPWEAIVRGMELSGGKYLQSLWLIILYTIVVVMISLLLAIISKMISAGTGIPHDIVKAIFQLLSQFLQGYTILCFTWWYLRLEKEAR